ncbi:MAG: DUF4910 domain-containing protein [Anaerolineales bacterium]
MKSRITLVNLSLAACALLASCATVPDPVAAYDPAALRFDGERAFEVESGFVRDFPNRHSGQPNNRAAAEWLLDEFTRIGLNCEMQEWQVINYSVPVDLQNVACALPGESAQEILIVAHHDQASTTIEGADNDGSGIAILIQLAEIFAGEPRPRYTLRFVSTDGEEYGMLGTYHYIQTHPNVENILAGFSLDNLGREYYDAMNIEQIGQYRNFGPIWLALALREAAEAGDLWTVNLRAPLDQVLDQAGPISFMDQGPMIAAGVPALGLTGHVPPGFGELHFHLWHDPDDTMEHQSAEVLGEAGLVAEALVRQLLATDEFPRAERAYLYFDGSNQILRGAPLYAIFAAFVALFFVGSFVAARASEGSDAEDPSLLSNRNRVKAPRFRSGKHTWRELVAGWKRSLPHLLALWLPLLASIVLTYVFVAVGIMDKYDTYPATSKDPSIYNPRWLAVIGFVLGMALFFWLGRKLAARYQASSLRGAKRRSNSPAASFADIKSLAFLVIGLGAVYIMVISPFSLLFLVPTLFWLLIAGRKGPLKALDILLFVLGGLVFYGLFYFFGFVVYDYGFAFAWFMLMMFSIQMTAFTTVVVITAIVGAGLSLVVEVPRANK